MLFWMWIWFFLEILMDLKIFFSGVEKTEKAPCQFFFFPQFILLPNASKEGISKRKVWEGKRSMYGKTSNALWRFFEKSRVSHWLRPPDTICNILVFFLHTSLFVLLEFFHVLGTRTWWTKRICCRLQEASGLLRIWWPLPVSMIN